MVTFSAPPVSAARLHQLPVVMGHSCSLMHLGRSRVSHGPFMRLPDKKFSTGFNEQTSQLHSCFIFYFPLMRGRVLLSPTRLDHVVLSPPREALISGGGRLRLEISLILRLTPARSTERTCRMKRNNISWSPYRNGPLLSVSGVMLIIDVLALTSAGQGSATQRISLTVLDGPHGSIIFKIFHQTELLYIRLFSPAFEWQQFSFSMKPSQKNITFENSLFGAEVHKTFDKFIIILYLNIYIIIFLEGERIKKATHTGRAKVL